MKKIFSLFLILVFVLTSCISAFASGSSLVTYSDGKSYEGLPSFPVTGNPSLVDNRYMKYTDYTLLQKDGEYLLFAYPQSGALYQSNFASFTGTIQQNYVVANLYYSDSACTQKITSGGAYVGIYSAYRLVDGVWAQSEQANTLSCTGYKILATSLDIYTDSTLTTVFSKSVTDPQISGLSSTQLKQMTLNQIVGLIPLVIGFLMLLLVFWKAWQFLLTLLKAV